MAQRTAGKREQQQLAATMRAQGSPWTTIAAALRDRAGLGARTAIRVAHGWSQTEVAERWNARWPDEPKTFKNISYWENWPSATGYAPSLAVLERLAQLYQCAVADLVADVGDHRVDDPAYDATASGPLASDVERLDLHQLTDVMGDWSECLPGTERRWLLLKLSTAAAAAAHRSEGEGRASIPGSHALDRLAGRWQSRYRYRSTSRATDLEGLHEVTFRAEKGRLIGRSEPHESGSVLQMELTVEGLSAAGSWSERTSPTGHYRAATYRGSVEFVVDPTGRSMSGKWLGLGKHFTVNSGDWELTWLAPGLPPTGSL